ncbi:MAG: ATP-binding protein [Acidimicrobiia bacterium]|nr:ATP-binding protein [Acidimicrobiia bacterium]
MTNLIENAEKYGGGATGITYEVVDDDVQIVVEDNGPGVPAEERDRIFERFARMGGVAGNRASDAGFGLGLSLVGEHVRLHGGQVWVTDRIDGQHGARFVVQLPLGPDRELHEEMAS